VLGEALDRDPFLLFELRGRTRRQVLDGLRAARDPAATLPARTTGARRSGRRDEPASAENERETEVGVTLGAIEPGQYDRVRDALPLLRFSFEERATPAAALRQLGTPPAWTGSDSPEEVLAPTLHAAAELARRIALQEADAGTFAPESSADDAKTPAPTKTAAAARSRKPSRTRRRPTRP
jgi:uncharacterized Zn finger protein